MSDAKARLTFDELPGRLQHTAEEMVTYARESTYNLDEALDAWLRWQGIIGYTRDILRVIEQFNEAVKEAGQADGW